MSDLSQYSEKVVLILKKLDIGNYMVQKESNSCLGNTGIGDKKAANSEVGFPRVKCTFTLMCICCIALCILSTAHNAKYTNHSQLYGNIKHLLSCEEVDGKKLLDSSKMNNNAILVHTTPTQNMIATHSLLT
jgi:hypothetical protein